MRRRRSAQGTGNNNKINWAIDDKQEVIDIIETVFRGARKGRERALSASASGRLVRDLHLGACWNAASLPNALVAQLCFIPLALSETTAKEKWRAALGRFDGEEERERREGEFLARYRGK